MKSVVITLLYIPTLLIENVYIKNFSNVYIQYTHMSAAAWQMHIPGLCCFFKRNTDLFAIMSPFSYSGPCAVFALYHCVMNNAEKCSFSSCFQSKEKALNGEKRGEERDQSRNGTKGEAKWRGKRTEMFQPGSDFGICRKSYWVTGGGVVVCVYI